MKNTTYTKISEFTTIITEKISRNRINVFTVYSDADETFCTMPKPFTTDADAQNEVIRLAKKLVPNA